MEKLSMDIRISHADSLYLQNLGLIPKLKDKIYYQDHLIYSIHCGFVERAYTEEYAVDVNVLKVEFNEDNVLHMRGVEYDGVVFAKFIFYEESTHILKAQKNIKDLVVEIIDHFVKNRETIDKIIQGRTIYGE